MKRIVKSIFIVILSVFLLNGFFACGSSDSGKGADIVDKSTKGPADSAEDNEAKAIATSEPAMDLDGRVVKLGSWFATDLPAEGGSASGDKFRNYVLSLYDKYNFTMEHITLPYEQIIDTLVSTTMAGAPYADIATVGNQHLFPGLLSQRIIQPLSDLPYLDFNESKWDRLFLQTGTYNDKVYGTYYGEIYPRCVFFFNKTTFENKNLPAIYDLVKNKQWTWDKMLEYAIACTEDIDNDGANDKYGLSGGYLESGLIYSNGGDTVRFVEGKPKLMLGEANAIEALNFSQELHQTHKVYCEVKDNLYDYPMTNFRDGNIAMLAGTLWYVESFFMEMNDNYGITYFPLGPKGTEYVSSADDCALVVFPFNIVKPEEVAFVLDVYSDPVLNFDINDWRERYETICRDDESVETLREIVFEHKSVSNMLMNIEPLQNTYWNLTWQIYSGQKTAQSMIDEVGPQMQQQLDDMYNLVMEGLQK